MQDPFEPTGRESDKVFQYAGGDLAPAKTVKQLPLDVREPAKNVHILPRITNNLLSTSKFVDANYAWVFDNDEVSVYDKNNTEIKTTRAAVLKGWRSPGDKLWRIPLVKVGATVQEGVSDTVAVAQSPQGILRNAPPKLTNELYNVYELQTKPELIRYLHVAVGFPTKTTWLATIRNYHYASWPALNVADAAKYFPEAEEVWKGHGRKIRAGLCSTMKKERNEQPALEDHKHLDLGDNKILFATIFDLKDEMDQKLYSDQMGRFLIMSYKGNQYIMVLYDMDISGAIMVEPMKNHSSGEMVRAYNAAMKRLHDAGIKPTMRILDNKCSDEFKDTIKSYDMKYQLVPPHDHRRNTAEKAVQIFKDHFIAVLCGTDENFPMKLWYQLLPHAEVQLHMLQKSRTTPKISVFSHLYGQHNFDATPFGILGSKIELHITAKQQKTWDTRTKTGY